MTKIELILFIFFTSFGLTLTAQERSQSPSKIDEVFFEYIVKNLSLNPEEAIQMRPLMKKYLNGRKKISKAFGDPLEREQQILSLKMASRKQMAEVIGMQKANAFFVQEQVFRRKVRDELKQRKMNPRVH